MRKTSTRYETMIRHDEAGAFKGGHHIDIIRYLPDEGEAAEDMPPPRTTDALPLTVEDLSLYLAADAAEALAGYSALKGQEIAGRAALERAQVYIGQMEGKLLEMAQQLDAAQAELAQFRQQAAAIAGGIEDILDRPAPDPMMGDDL